MRLICGLIAALALAAPAGAWHPVGHRIVGAIAYDALSPRARRRADDLLRRHPDYARFTEGVAGDARKTARWAFINASAWADEIRGDERFYDDTNPRAKPTPPLPGFPSMKRHTNWHYVNLYFSPDNTPFPETPSPSALTELPRMIQALAQGGAEASYFLPWLLHVAGDVHQPMHCVSRFTKHLTDRDGKPTSDLGGNLVSVDGYTNLHALWDNLLGVNDDEEYIEWMVRRLRRGTKPERTPVTEPERWIREGFEIARGEAYRFPAEAGVRHNPFRTTPAYTRNAQRVARQRAALAGYRIAAVLNAHLRGRE